MDKQASSGEQCIVCGKSANASVKRELTKDFHLCDSCYKTAYELDMTVARKLKFEPADHVIDNIFLGSEGSTIREDWLRTHRIDRIITVAAHMERLKQFENIEYTQFEIDDHPSENIQALFDPIFQIIKKKTDTNVLVHCVSGISRSGSVLVAYCMKARKLNYNNALEYVRSKRAVVSPNSGFQKQLREYDNQFTIEQEYSL